MDLTLYQLRVIGAQALVRKLMKRILSKSRARKARTRDLRNSTFAATIPADFSIRNGVISFDEIVQAIGEDSEFLEQTKADLPKLISHEYKFLSDKPFSRNRTETHSDLVNAFVNESNRNESKRIYELISPDYKLINWQADHSVGIEWDSRKHVTEISYGKNSADIKVPWELGRFQHVIPQVLSNSIGSKTDLIACEFANQFLDFAAFNPPRFGVQWKCTMDVALRAFSLLAARDGLISSGCELPDEIDGIFARSIYEHGIHIRENLEWNEGARGNHYLANLLGLIAIGSYATGSQARKWLVFGAKELDKEIKYQFNSDGTNFEASTNYHVFALEMVLWALYLLRGSPEKAFISNESFARIRKAMEFVFALSSAGGHIPQIGDNDGGRVFPMALSEGDKRTVFILYSLLTADQSYNEYFGLITGLLGESSYPELKCDFVGYMKSIEGRVQSFDKFGLYTFRNSNYIATFRCGDVGQRGKGGHAHCDQLALTLSIGGREIITDCGTFVYTSNPLKRNQFRSSLSHSTIIIEGEEQLPFGEKATDDLFWIKDNKLNTDIEISGHCKIKASHYGYSRRVNRSIEFFEKKVLLTDTSDAESFESRFVLGPVIRAEIREGNSIDIIYDDTVLTLKIKRGIAKIISVEYSETYGVVSFVSCISIKNQSGSIVIELTLDD